MESAEASVLDARTEAPLLPDCSNPGVALRIVAMLQVVALMVAWSASTGFGDLFAHWGAQQFAVLPAILIGLPAFCLIRRRALGWSEGRQWIFLLVFAASLAAGSAWWAGHMRAEFEGHLQPDLFALIGRAGAGAALAALIAVVLRWREQALSPALDRARLQALQSRIRPHFLFNALNAVLGLLRSEPRRAEAVLEGLADLFRMLLRDERELVPLSDEVAFCRDYLAVESERLGDRLEAQFDIDPAALGAMVPPLLLQPLLENAVHHGIEPAERGGWVLLRVSRRADRVQVLVENPVVREAALRPGRQMALSNIRQRLALLYDIEASMHMERSKDLFRLTLEFPCREHGRHHHA